MGSETPHSGEAGSLRDRMLEGRRGIAREGFDVTVPEGSGYSHGDPKIKEGDVARVGIVFDAVKKDLREQLSPHFGQDAKDRLALERAVADFASKIVMDIRAVETSPREAQGKFGKKMVAQNMTRDEVREFVRGRVAEWVEANQVVAEPAPRNQVETKKNSYSATVAEQLRAQQEALRAQRTRQKPVAARIAVAESGSQTQITGSDVQVSEIDPSKRRKELEVKARQLVERELNEKTEEQLLTILLDAIEEVEDEMTYLEADKTDYQPTIIAEKKLELQLLNSQLNVLQKIMSA